MTLWNLLEKIKDLGFRRLKPTEALGFASTKQLLIAIFDKFNAKTYNRKDPMAYPSLWSWLWSVKNAVLLEFWRIWLDARLSKTDEDVIVTDLFALHALNNLRDKQISWLFKTTEASYSLLAPCHKDKYLFRFVFRTLQNSYWNDAEVLLQIAEIIEKLGEEGKEIRPWATTIRARIQALILKDELEEKTLKPFKEFVEKSQQDITTLKKETDEKIKSSERNSIQIIGIFAAIIAFIVTIVPTAVRLGGASVPIALAGLAIVTAGIIILLAMIFGREGKRKSGLITGIIIIGVLFLAWIILAVWAAVYYPGILVTTG